MKKRIAVALSVIALLAVLTGCGSSYDAQDLRDAQNRYYSGKYTREDERMVQGFNKWKEQQNKYID